MKELLTEIMEKDQGMQILMDPALSTIVLKIDEIVNWINATKASLIVSGSIPRDIT